MASEITRVPEEIFVSLFHGWIDYAGLYPPAGLPLAQVRENYLAYRRSEQSSWFLGRLVLPLNQVLEFDRQLPAEPDTDPADRVPLSVVVGTQWQQAAEQIGPLELQLAGSRIVSLEGKWHDTISTAADEPLLQDKTVYVELGVDPQLEQRLGFLQESDWCAKLRMGGVKPEAIPDAQSVLAFMAACRKFDIAYKLTAGLHHFWQGNYPLSYDTDSPTAVMYGFFQVVLATLLIESTNNTRAALDLLQSPRQQGLDWSNQRLSRKDCAWDMKSCQALRKNRLHAVGSCSFTEPLEDLLKSTHHTTN